MEKLYRRDYQGEFVNYLTNRVRGKVIEHRDWVPNTITERHTGNAFVFGNGPSRLGLNWNLFKLHRGGLMGNLSAVTYGCNALYRDYDPHVLVVRHPIIADEIARSGYADNNICITSAKNAMKHPDKFHLVPFDPGLTAGATALYVAAFDDHRKIYMLGFDGCDGPGNNIIYASTPGYPARTQDVNSQQWIDDAVKVFNTYDQTEFIHVMPHEEYPMPEAWKYCANVRSLSMRRFVSEVDLGAT